MLLCILSINSLSCPGESAPGTGGIDGNDGEAPLPASRLSRMDSDWRSRKGDWLRSDEKGTLGAGAAASSSSTGCCGPEEGSWTTRTPVSATSSISTRASSPTAGSAGSKPSSTGGVDRARGELDLDFLAKKGRNGRVRLIAARQTEEPQWLIQASDMLTAAMVDVAKEAIMKLAKEQRHVPAKENK